jgi:hypothetical protein
MRQQKEESGTMARIWDVATETALMADEYVTTGTSLPATLPLLFVQDTVAFKRIYCFLILETGDTSDQAEK